MPHLDDGPVMLTEFSNAQTELPAVTLMARIHAPAALVAEVVLAIFLARGWNGRRRREPARPAALATLAHFG